MGLELLFTTLKKEKNMRKILFLTGLIAFVLTSSVWAADISGNCTIKMTGPAGEESVPMVIKATGENFTITADHPNAKEMIGTGTLKGDTINFNIKATDETEREFIFTGKVTGNKMAGTREFRVAGQAPASAQGDQGGEQNLSIDWTAEKN